MIGKRVRRLVISTAFLAGILKPNPYALPFRCIKGLPDDARITLDVVNWYCRADRDRFVVVLVESDTYEPVQAGDPIPDVDAIFEHARTDATEAAPAGLKAGDVVKLKSGGPRMTIGRIRSVELTSGETIDVADCLHIWHEDVEVREVHLPLNSLVFAPA